MSYDDCLTTDGILEVLNDEISARQGKMLETLQHRGSLFARSLLPDLEEIRVRDRVQSGVALRATQSAVWVYPYVFRLVCRNGAIIARAAEGREISELDALPAHEAETLLREAIAASAEKQSFANTAEQMRSAAQRPFDLVLTMMPMLARLSSINSQLARQVLDHFVRDHDKTQYGLMNVVTALARDTRDADLRWKLEEFGGELALQDSPEHELSKRYEQELPQTSRVAVS